MFTDKTILGQTFVLASGGPLMTVIDVRDPADARQPYRVLVCSYEDKDGKMTVEQFPSVCLRELRPFEMTVAASA